MPAWLEELWIATNVGLLLWGFVASVFAFVALVLRMWRAGGQQRADLKQSLAAVVAYIVSATLIIVLVIAIVGGQPCPDHMAFAAVIAVLGWILYSALWMARLAPRPPDMALPSWIGRPLQTIDWLALAIVGAALLYLIEHRSACGV